MLEAYCGFVVVLPGRSSVPRENARGLQGSHNSRLSYHVGVFLYLTF